MKLIRVELTREQAATVTVAVPDDFDEQLLYRHPYKEAFKPLVQDAEWDDDDELGSLAVESYDVLTGEEAAQEARDYTVHDITDALAKKAVEHTEWLARREAAKQAKEAKEPTKEG